MLLLLVIERVMRIVEAGGLLLESRIVEVGVAGQVGRGGPGSGRQEVKVGHYVALG